MNTQQTKQEKEGFAKIEDEGSIFQFDKTFESVETNANLLSIEQIIKVFSLEINLQIWE